MRLHEFVLNYIKLQWDTLETLNNWYVSLTVFNMLNFLFSAQCDPTASTLMQQYKTKLICISCNAEFMILLQTFIEFPFKPPDAPFRPLHRNCLALGKIETNPSTDYKDQYGVPKVSALLPFCLCVHISTSVWVFVGLSLPISSVCQSLYLSSGAWLVERW